MKSIGIIGRSEFTYKSMLLLKDNGYDISFIVTCKEAPEYKYTSTDFKDFAKHHGIPFLYKANVSADDIKNLVTGLPEIVISVNYSGIIKQDIIDLFKIGILNAHGGDLPRYRGNACQAWAIINGENKIGLCIHKMIGGELDSGPIIARSYLPININTRIKQVYNWMESEIPKLMYESVEKLNEDSDYHLEIQSTDPLKALRCYPRNPSDGKINWQSKREDIIRLINASSEPYPGSYCYLDDGRKLIIWRAVLYDDFENYLSVCGQVSEIKDTGEIIVICGNGKIMIQEVSLEDNKERILPSDIIKSIRKRLL